MVTAGRGSAVLGLGPRPGAFLIAYRQVDPEVIKSDVSSRFGTLRRVTNRVMNFSTDFGMQFRTELN